MKVFFFLIVFLKKAKFSEEHLDMVNLGPTFPSA